MKDLVSTVAALAANLSERERQLLRIALTPAPEPVAIVGIGCRFPGGADDPEGFWRLLDRGGDAVREVPADRWDLATYFDPDPEAPGRMSTRHGAFLDHVDQFDPGFFEISPHEARRMDPQQRLLLEVAHEALLDAGLPVDDLRGSPAGVFIGACNHDYDTLQPGPADAHTLTGGLMSVLSGRLSHVLGVRGPSLTIDTACSSSLVALHLACNSLRARETELALAGGVNLILSPESHIRLSRMRALAPDGRCRTFDARASGYVRGEGVGVLVLKRLGDALRDADRIWAVIRGSAVNHDGRSTSLTAPNGLSQREVITRALADARVRADAIDYVEAHGTGTPLGDPIEVESLRDLFSGPQPCVLGSVKTNIGHLEGAAGIAGVIKVALSLAHERIPKHLHFHEQNPRIDLGTLEVASETRPWPRGERERLAGVSSFGISGTNAHIILAEAPGERREPLPARTEPHVLPLSAHTPAALAQLARSWSEHLRRGEVPLTDLVHTAATRRSHQRYRLAVTGTSAEALARALDTTTLEHEPTGTDLAAQYMRGEAIAWSSIYPGRRPPTTLPHHPWQHARYWAEPGDTGLTTAPEPEPQSQRTTAGELELQSQLTTEQPALATITEQPALATIADRPALEASITAAVREVLGFEASLRIPAAQDLRDLGLDSLLALDLATAIGRRLDRTLINSFALDYPSIAAMTDALARTEAP